MDSSEFRFAAKKAIDEIADYYDGIGQHSVVAKVEPGYLRPQLPSRAPMDGEPFSEIQADIAAKILPGITHWQSPRFMAFFPCENSFPAAIAEMYSNAFNGAHFNWICSPAVTELETIVLDWLAQALALPECFLSGGPTHGGGVIQGSASEAVLTVMVAAREKYLAEATEHLEEGSEEKEEDLWRRKGKLVALGGANAHSATQKAAQILGVRFVPVPVTRKGELAVNGSALEKTLAGLEAKGLEPFYLTTTLGTTEACAVDDFESIADVLANRGRTRGRGSIWVHVDAAYAGSALLLEENQYLTRHFSSFDSFNFNPHKWLLTTFDCSALWVQNRKHLITVLSIKPPFLRNEYSESELVTDYRDWQIPLGRRFRSLKLWFVIRSYGIRGLQAHIRKGIELCEDLEAKLRAAPDTFEVFTAARFGLLTLRLRAETDEKMDGLTKQLYEQLIKDGEFYLTSTEIQGMYAIRVCTAVSRVDKQSVDRLFKALSEGAQKLQ